MESPHVAGTEEARGDRGLRRLCPAAILRHYTGDTDDHNNGLPPPPIGSVPPMLLFLTFACARTPFRGSCSFPCDLSGHDALSTEPKDLCFRNEPVREPLESGPDSGPKRSGDTDSIRTPGPRHTRDLNGFIVRINCSNQEGLTC